MNLGQYIAQEVQAAIERVLTAQKGEFQDVAVAGGEAAASGMLGDVGRITDIITNIVGDIPIIGSIIDRPLKVFEDVENSGGKFGRGIGLGYLTGYAGYQLLQPYLREATHFIENLAQSQIFDPQTAADLAARGIISDEFAHSEAGGGGLDTPHENWLIDAAQTRPDVVTLLQLLNRDLTTDGEVDGALQRLGYQPNWRESLKGLRRQLLSPADLALAFLRTSITRETMEGYAKQLGVTVDDMQVLIDNTGEPPGPEQLMEALRRGFIDRERFDRGIRQSRVRDEWVDVEYALRLQPMSVADSVRAVVENYITEDEGKAIAELNGLEPKYYHTLVESWGRPLSHEQMGSLYYRGLASRKQFDQAMRESDIKNKYINQSFELTRRLLPERLIVQAIHYNAVSMKDGARMLMELGYDQQTTGVVLKLGLHEQQGLAHQLTRAEIVSLYEDQVLSKDQALQHLVTLGYTEQNARYVLTIADTANHAKEVRAEELAIRSSYLAKGIDKVQAHAQLLTIGLSASQADHMISVWDREAHRAERVLTEAQIVKAAKEGTITADDGLALLIGAGYSPPNARILLLSNGATFKPATA